MCNNRVMDARRSLLSTQEAGVALGYSSRYFFVRESVRLSKLISSSISSPNNLTLSTSSSRVPFNSILSCFSLVVSFDFKLLLLISIVLVFEEFNGSC